MDFEDISHHCTEEGLNNEFGYNEYLVTTNRFLCIKIIDNNFKKFGYYKHPPTKSDFLLLLFAVRDSIHFLGFVSAFRNDTTFHTELKRPRTSDSLLNNNWYMWCSIIPRENRNVKEKLRFLFLTMF